MVHPSATGLLGPIYGYSTGKIHVLLFYIFSDNDFCSLVALIETPKKRNEEWKSYPPLKRVKHSRVDIASSSLSLQNNCDVISKCQSVVDCQELAVMFADVLWDRIKKPPPKDTPIPLFHRENRIIPDLGRMV